jgi:hypothetical protein
MVTPDIIPLNARAYGIAVGDFQTVAAWWWARHGYPFPEILLPPLGVVVNRGHEPVAALWAYQSVGIGVAFLEFAITRPGLSLREAHAAMGFALMAVELILTRDNYSVIRCFAGPAVARAAKRHGFHGEHGNLTKII